MKKGIIISGLISLFVGMGLVIPAIAATKAELDSLAMAVLKAAENHDDQAVQSYMYKMMEKGVTGGSDPLIMSKKTPQCPPIKMNLNGRTLSGSLCAKFAYEYNNKEYWVGYCK